CATPMSTPNGDSPDRSVGFMEDSPAGDNENALIYRISAHLSRRSDHELTTLHNWYADSRSPPCRQSRGPHSRNEPARRVIIPCRLGDAPRGIATLTVAERTCLLKRFGLMGGRAG